MIASSQPETSLHPSTHPPNVSQLLDTEFGTHTTRCKHHALNTNKTPSVSCSAGGPGGPPDASAIGSDPPIITHWHTHTPGLRPCARTSSHKNKKNFPTDTDRPDDDHQPPSWGRPHPHHCQQHRRTKTHSDSETIQTSYQKSIQIHIKTNSKQLTHIDAAAAAAARAAAAGVTRREEWNESDRDRPWQIEYISQTPGVLAQDTISEFEGQPPAGPVHWHALAGCRLPGRAALEAAKKACHHVVENMLLPR